MSNQISIEVKKHKSEYIKWYQFYVGLDIIFSHESSLG
ncbi:hypothetical protein HPL003_25940 [Paenibacillus terrae HPL-003]|uniref:Uncharacterized protein n=1 Tax=Paenibacillus terrae (strain HPL-003) TaxID=985665 RepID=G7VQS4_PAETH|nr:hypothetical protein HPL003_25940 [Paenibacillus terrae HPL-003]